jgi:hypothetical protein
MATFCTWIRFHVYEDVQFPVPKALMLFAEVATSSKSRIFIAVRASNRRPLSESTSQSISGPSATISGIFLATE